MNQYYKNYELRLKEARDKLQRPQVKKDNFSQIKDKVKVQNVKQPINNDISQQQRIIRQASQILRRRQISRQLILKQQRIKDDREFISKIDGINRQNKQIAINSSTKQRDSTVCQVKQDPIAYQQSVKSFTITNEDDQLECQNAKQVKIRQDRFLSPSQKGIAIKNNIKQGLDIKVMEERKLGLGSKTTQVNTPLIRRYPHQRFFTHVSSISQKAQITKSVITKS